MRRALISSALIVALLAVSISVWLYRTLAASLPQVDGEVELVGLSAAVRIDRDALGVPTIAAENRIDAARALGFVHAQDRLFQMDLMRRQAAGELAELLGPALLPVDRTHRVHRFRYRATRTLSALSADESKIAVAYVEGVNAGVEHLERPPFEYLLLGADPRPWSLEDIALVAYSMYLDLNDSRGAYESDRGLVYDLLGPEMFDFLYPLGTRWDAPVSGGSFSTPPIPGPEVLDLRSLAPLESAELLDRPAASEPALGSNNWAVSGRLTEHGGALLANDMHLGHAVPNIWYRARLSYPLQDGEPWSVTGVTLPGVPLVIAGSNGNVAWGHTNTWGDWQDLVIVETEPDAPGLYRTSDGGIRSFDHRTEAIHSSDGTVEQLEVVETIWGPVIDVDHRGRQRALRWIAHDRNAMSFALLEVERASSVGAALDAASRVGSPPQNFVVADSSGAIGWTVMGAIPRRVGLTGRRPRSWVSSSSEWAGYLDYASYPRIEDSAIDRIWTANARVIGGDAMTLIGLGGYRLGARAGQIRDRLLAAENFDEKAMLAIQLDDSAFFLERWHGLLMATLSRAEATPRLAPLIPLVDGWGARAAADSVGYRAVREFRRVVAALVLGSITAPCKAADPRFDHARILQYEGPLWKIVEARPNHLLDGSFDTWDDLFLAAAQRVHESLTDDRGRLAGASWGHHNTVRIRHPLSVALPVVGRWLDMPPSALPGDSNMPRFQSPTAGASQRMVVAPGREENAIFHMPTGQSGHPLSPHYDDGHEAWLRGAATPFLPGPAKHTLTLLPAS